MSDYEYFIVNNDSSVATITLNCPPLNVLNISMMAEMNKILESLLTDSSLAALVITANGKAFSAGVDVSDHTEDKVDEMIRLFHGIFRKLAATEILTIAAVPGAALGGGCELACFCDIVLASDRAKFGQPEVQVGVFPPVAACIFPYQIGIKKAVELTALGATIKADEAYKIGLVNQVYPADEFAAKVDDYVNHIKTLSAPVVRLAKKATMSIARKQIMTHLDIAEKIYLDELMDLSDAHEGIAAFLEKRTPQWKHS